MVIADLRAGDIYYLSNHEFIIINSKKGDEVDYTSVYMDRSNSSKEPLLIRHNTYVPEHFERLVSHINFLDDIVKNVQQTQQELIYFLFETDAKR